MPYVVSDTRKAYQVTVPDSAAASSRACFSRSASASPLPGLASISARKPRSTVIYRSAPVGYKRASAPKRTGLCSAPVRNQGGAGNASRELQHMTASEASLDASARALIDLEANRGAFVGALACAPDAALRYRAPGEEYALGGLVEHVAAVTRHYTRALARVREPGSDHIAVPDAEQDLAAIGAGLTAEQRADAIRQLTDAHAAFVAELRQVDPREFRR